MHTYVGNEKSVFIKNVQASRSSQVFDIALPGESDGSVTYHVAVAPARPLRPASLVLPGLVEPKTHVCELCILERKC